MNNAVMVFLTLTYFSLYEYAPGINPSSGAAGSRPEFPYIDNEPFNLRLSKVILWTGILYNFLIPLGLVFGHFIGYIVNYGKRKSDIIKFPLILASIPFNMQYLMIPLLGGFSADGYSKMHQVGNLIRFFF